MEKSKNIMLLKRKNAPHLLIFLLKWSRIYKKITTLPSLKEIVEFEQGSASRNESAPLILENGEPPYLTSSIPSGYPITQENTWVDQEDEYHLVQYKSHDLLEQSSNAKWKKVVEKKKFSPTSQPIKTRSQTSNKS